MTVLATKLCALKDLRIARAAIRATMAPQPDALRNLLLTSATQRLTTAADLLGGLSTRRPMEPIIGAARGAIDSLGAEAVTFGAKHEASTRVRTAISLLKHEPDVAHHVQSRRDAIKAVVVGIVT